MRNAQSGEKALPPVTVDAPRRRSSAPRESRSEAAVASGGGRRRAAAAPERQSPVVVINTEGSGANASLGTPPIKQRFQLPQESFSITAKQIDETINLKDPEDAVKYMPSLFVRKRNDGDNQAVLATRSWGLNSSARTLIYYDDLLISALIGNNNSGASPHWNLVSPEAIARIDFLNGPFAAAYPGNSIGGVLLITSKMPDKPFAVAKETVSVMPWNQYGTKDTYVTSQTSAAAGNRNGKLSWLVSANYLDSYQQPLTYTTNGTVNPAGTRPGTISGAQQAGRDRQCRRHRRAGAFAADLGQSPAGLRCHAAGAGDLFVRDLEQSPDLRSADLSDIDGDGRSRPSAASASFASNKYIWDQTHLSNAVSLKSDTKGVFDFDLSASSYNYLQDILLNPFTVAPSGVGYSQNGKITRNDGTNWQNADAKGIWRPFGIDGPQEISFGVHGDRYRLENPVYLSSVWYRDAVDRHRSALFGRHRRDPHRRAVGAGRLEDRAESEADARRPAGKLAGAGRLQSQYRRRPAPARRHRRSPDVFADTISRSSIRRISRRRRRCPTIRTRTGTSPRISARPTAIRPSPNSIRTSSVGGVATFANPDPDAGAGFHRRTEHRAPLERRPGPADAVQGEDQQRDHLADQPRDQRATGAQTPTTTISNVAAIRMQGVELSADKDNVLINGLQLFGSVTYVDSRILSDPTWAGTNPLTGLPDTVVGKRVPNVPDWRAKFGVTYRPNDSWAYTVAARYSGKQYSTLDNTDIIPHVFGAFDNFFVVDMKVHYNATKNFSFDFGIDNLFNEQYFLFHPFPGRTFVLAGKYTF